MHSSRLIVVGALGVAALITIVTVAVLAPWRGPGAVGVEGAPVAQSTVEVVAGNMVSETKVPGVIAYAQTTEVSAGRAGVITELPPAETVVTAGGVLYRIDTHPVILFAGGLPVWRDFGPDMTDGNDVLQLERNLAALGFFPEEPDAAFDWDTTVAIREWQGSLGLERTGTVERWEVVFWNDTLRVDSVDARLGQDVGPGSVVFHATGVEKVVDVAVKSSDRSLAVVGQLVTVTLPDGTTTEGTIQTVGAPTSRTSSDGTSKEIVVPVRVVITDQADIAELALASVSVGFASTIRSDVLTVPVDALVPLDDTHYAVEVPAGQDSEDRELVPVEVGAITSGQVEISGDGIVEGLTVVVPRR